MRFTGFQYSAFGAIMKVEYFPYFKNLRKENNMNVQTLTFIQVSEKAEHVIALGRRYHWQFRIVPDFQGVIDKPVFSTQGDWLYMPIREEDKAIIPNAAYRRHTAVEKAGYGVAQVVIGHELKVAPGMPVASRVAPLVTPTKPTREIDWGNVAEVAGKGFLVGIMGFAMVSIYALIGALQLFDPSYCIVLNDPGGTVIELIRWNTEG